MQQVKNHHLKKLMGIFLSLTEETKSYPLLTTMLIASAEIAKNYSPPEKKQVVSRVNRKAG